MKPEPAFKVGDSVCIIASDHNPSQTCTVPGIVGIVQELLGWFDCPGDKIDFWKGPPGHIYYIQLLEEYTEFGGRYHELELLKVCKKQF